MSYLRILSMFCAMAVLSLTGCGGGDKKDKTTPAKDAGKDAGKNTGKNAADKPSYSFVTNGVAGFWTIAKAGADKAGADLGVDVVTIMPAGITDQTRKIEDLLTRGTQGIAISPINPENQGETLNTAAAKTNLITHDSDAPDSNRQLYIGMDNYEAGLVCGKLCRSALPDGGKVMIFIGRLDQDNAKRRRQGCIDGILDRKPDPTRRDPVGGEIKSDDGKYNILGTLTDNFDRAKAKANVEDALTRTSDIAAMVGLFEYNNPLIMEALERAGRLGTGKDSAKSVKVIAFDEAEMVLQGIKDGTVVGTVVQNPYMYGYKSIEVLNQLHKGNKGVIPADKFINIPARVILKDDSKKEFGGAKVVAVDEFWTDLKMKLGGGAAPAPAPAK